MGNRKVTGTSLAGAQFQPQEAPYRKFFWMLATSWTLAIVLSLTWNFVQNADESYRMTAKNAQAVLQKDLLYRQWSMLHGAVYVPKSSQPGSGADQDDPERDVITPSGERLTLLNPASVSRQIFELQDRNLGVRGRITSLSPVRASNSPDPWEKRALMAFEKGEDEVSGIETQDGKRFFRMIRPLITVPSCLRCHEERGRIVGQVRGGISVTVPMEHYSMHRENLHLGAAHLGLWGFGLAGLLVGLRNLENHNSRRLEAEGRTRNALNEKEALLQEIHHRVKNNLQVVSSLLQLQSNQITDATALKAFQESQVRLQCMALIHEKLYQSDSLARVDLADYLRGLTSLLFSTYAGQSSRVKFELKLATAPISIDMAIPLGLIANELLTNSLKSAFPNGRQGTIRLELEARPNGVLCLRVEDDGVGLPPGFDLENAKSLGMRLVRMLATQLETQAIWNSNGNGTSFTLEFRGAFPPAPVLGSTGEGRGNEDTTGPSKPVEPSGDKAAKDAATNSTPLLGSAVRNGA